MARAGGAALFALGLGLAACAPPAELGPSVSSAPQASLAAPRTAAPVTVGALPSLATPQEATSEPYGPPIEPEFLVGLDRIQLQRAIGSPTLRRREGAAEVWQYQGPTCVMDAFLYVTSESRGQPRVTYVELRRGGVAALNEPEERRRCYAEAFAEGRRNAALTAKKP